MTDGDASIIDDQTEVDLRKLRTLIRRYALSGNFTADEILALGSNASFEQEKWARELVEQMPEQSKPWTYEYRRQACQNPCCNPWAGQATFDSSPSVDPWASDPSVDPWV